MTWLSQCIWCHETDYIRGDLCDSCWSALPHTATSCGQCAMPLPSNNSTECFQRCGQCQQTMPPLDYCYAGFHYISPISLWIKQAKDHHRLHSVVRLERLLTRYLDSKRLTPDIVISVPSSRGRLFKRGFNVSEMLAKAVAMTLKCPIGDRWIRLQRTTPQRGQGRWLRMINSRAKFLVSPSVDASYAEQYPHLLLVDDVMTTGATLNTLAAQLKSHGIKTVGALVLARSI